MALAIRLNFLCRYLRFDGGQLLLAVTLLFVEATLATSTTFALLLLLATFAVDASGTIFGAWDFLSSVNKASPASSRLRGLAEYCCKNCR
uniref:Putative secreted peptide n=1 Tax=Anopheles braziliensis TaxID=58242 RepID=A0A2M3ZPU4_9DIPT